MPRSVSCLQNAPAISSRDFAFRASNLLKANHRKPSEQRHPDSETCHKFIRQNVEMASLPRTSVSGLFRIRTVTRSSVRCLLKAKWRSCVASRKRPKTQIVAQCQIDSGDFDEVGPVKLFWTLRKPYRLQGRTKTFWLLPFQSSLSEWNSMFFPMYGSD